MVPDFSLSRWLQDEGQAAGAVLSDLFISKLMETLGWTPYLNNPDCSMSSYQPANADNWKVADCPLQIGNNTLPSLRADLSCRLPSHCTGVDCCLAVNFISRNLNAYVDLDACHFTLNFGIEKLQYQIMLFTYEWGKQEHLYLNGGFRLDYTIDNNEADNTFIFSLNISLCLEGLSAGCMEQIEVFKNSALPKPGCNWAMGFSIPDFSVNDWITNNGLAVGQSLSRYYAAKLMEYLGVSKYMMTTPCQRSSSYYSPSQNHWKQDCPLDISLPDITSVPMTCYIPDYCTGIDCCLDVDFLGMSFRTYLLLDGCNLNLQIGIEQLALNESLDSYIFGTPKQLYVEGVLRIDYLIEDLTVERKYKVDVNISICLNADPSVACLYTVEVYRDTLLPKPLCDISGGFSIPDFSLVEWFTNRTIAIGTTLASAVATELMEELGISSFLNTDQCSLSSDTYADAVNGWTSDCPFEMSLPSLGTTDIRCNLPSYCSGVQCCMQVDFISRSFHAFATINTCTHQLEVGIEKFVFNRSLFNYEWGTRENIWLLGVVRVDFTLTEKTLTSYELNMNISVCFEAADSCLMSERVFINTELPKVFCTWGSGLIIPDFNLEEWVTEQSGVLESVLTSTLADTLLEVLAVKPYLNDPMCSLTDHMYTPAVNGFKDECGVSLPSLPSGVSCHIPTSCSGLDCCLKIPLISKFIHVYAHLDPCSYILRLGIEKLSFNISLIDYDFGQEHTFLLQGVFKIIMVIDDLKADRAYLLNVNVSACFDTVDDSRCLNVPVLVNTKLPKLLCNWNLGFSIPDFDLNTWLTNRGYNPAQDLQDAAFMYLMLELGIYDYLDESPCDASASGWQSTACGESLSLPTLPGNMACRISDLCTGVDCCTSVPKLTRNFHSHLLLDACALKLSIGIEKLFFNISLVDYQFGKSDNFNLFGLVNIDFIIEDVASQNLFVVNLNISVCYDETTVPCAMETVVFEDVQLPKPLCSYSNGFLDKKILTELYFADFSLSNWMNEKDLALGSDLPSWATDLLLQKMGIAALTEDTPCTIYSGPYGDLPNGWSSDCSLSLDLPTLPSYLSCHVPDICTGAVCCARSTVLGRTFRANMILDACNYKVTISVEKLTIKKILLDYNFGQWEEMDLGGLIVARYKIDDITAEKKYLMNLQLSLCLESGGDCIWSHNLLQDTKVSKLACHWGDNFPIPGFHINDYLINRGLAGAVLSSLEGLQLLETLGVLEYMLETPCDRTVALYTPRNAQGWKSMCTDPDVTMTTLPSWASANLYSSCTGVSMCLYLDFLDRTVNAQLELDACSYQLHVGIERFQFSFTLFDFEYGTNHRLTLFEIFTLEYMIVDLTGERKFIVNMNISVCFDDDRTSCQFYVSVFDNTILPKPECSWSRDFLDNSFSLETWLATNHYSPGQILSSTALSQLLQTLGLGEYLNDPQCDRYSSPFSGAILGWTTDCFDVDLPDLPSNLTCHLDSTCTGINCCVDVNFMQRSFNAYVKLEPCDYKISVGIEKLQFEKILRDFDFGVWQNAKLFGVVSLDFIVDVFHADNIYLISMDLSLCFEAGQPCKYIYPLFVNTPIPKPVCNWNRGFLDPVFSLNQWKLNRGIGIMDALAYHDVSQLLQDIGSSDLIRQEACRRSEVPYSGANSLGWIDQCSGTTSGLQSLGSGMTCRVVDSCTGVDCCIDSDTLGFAINAYIYVDACNYRLSIGVELLQLNYTLVDFVYGEHRTVSLVGMANLDYLIVDLESEDSFVVSVNISICFESSDACEVSKTILDSVKMKKPVCNWGTDFLIPGFSYNDWLDSQQWPIGRPLDSTMINRLEHILGIAYYYQDTPCQRSAYSPTNTQGWNKGCQPSVDLPTLVDAMTCNLYDTIDPNTGCTSVRCCTDVALIGRSIYTYVTVDPCNFKLTVGIEKFTLVIGLLDYVYGTIGHTYLHGVIRVDYMIEDLGSERKFLVSLNTSICFDSGSCNITGVILNEVKLPKPVCDLSAGFIDEDFSLEQWKDENGIVGPVTGYYVNQLMDTLKINDFLLDTPCQRASVPYSLATNGVYNECASLTSTLPTITEPASCHILSHCTGIYCCMEPDDVDTAFQAFVEFFPCQFEMKMGIEKLVFTVSLYDFEFGKEYDFYMFGAVRIHYYIIDLVEAGLYVFNARFKVCFEADDSKPCDVDFVLFDQYLIPKQACNWAADFNVPGFSLSSWLVSEGVTMSVPLPSVTVSSLMSYLKLAVYQFDTSCDQSSGIYLPTTDIWNSDCPKSINLPSISDDITCNVPDTCTGVNCCLNVPILDQTFQLSLNLDSCYKKLRVSIEKIYLEESLIGYPFGTEKYFYFYGMIRMMYKLEYMMYDRSYLISLGIQVCLETAGPCAQNFTLLDSVRFPEPDCTWDAEFVNPDFSLSQWLQERSIASGTELTTVYESELMQDLWIVSYLQHPACNGTWPLYNPSTNGWKSDDCSSLPETLPDLSAYPVTCALQSSCTSWICCVELSFVQQNFLVRFDIQPCDLLLSIQMEDLDVKIPLLDDLTGRQRSFYLNGVLRADYTIFNLESEGMYLVNLDLSLCFEKSSCEWTAPVLKNTPLPKQSCDWNRPMADPGFSLATWKSSVGAGTVLTDVEVVRLLHVLEVGLYLSTNPCNTSATPYTPDVNGWNKMLCFAQPPLPVIHVADLGEDQIIQNS
ncbi:uncharacterized protein LOC117314596 [Pecten maximus]|uniref:uncharacterized protein LOC117314596 n=1 Tax=Pecten maximus TaxID=6579 RepID=UPI0014590326|nr:uncharacterized protein LOC117314596 [Pecten maximus]